jgi:alanyl-tRNA synthetase
LGVINKYEAIVIAGLDDKIIIACSKDMAKSARDIMAALAARYGGRGGGTPQIAQGGGFKIEDVKRVLAEPGEILG